MFGIDNNLLDYYKYNPDRYNTTVIRSTYQDSLKVEIFNSIKDVFQDLTWIKANPEQLNSLLKEKRINIALDSELFKSYMPTNTYNYFCTITLEHMFQRKEYHLCLLLGMLRKRGLPDKIKQSIDADDGVIEDLRILKNKGSVGYRKHVLYTRYGFLLCELNYDLVRYIISFVS